jgi:two-component system, LytTR family, response regulator
MEINPIRIGSHKKVEPKDVMILEGLSNYTKVHFSSGKTIIVATNLKKLEDRFCLSDSSFFRTHKSFIINLNYMRDFDYNEAIEMDNDQIVIVSRRRRSKLVKVLQQFQH